MKGKYFTLNELTRSDTARRKGIDNTPDEQIISKLEELVRYGKQRIQVR